MTHGKRRFGRLSLGALASQRTVLANKRTALAYVRTTLTCLVAGVTLIQFFAFPFTWLGWGCIAAAGIVAVIGAISYVRTDTIIR